MKSEGCKQFVVLVGYCDYLDVERNNNTLIIIELILIQNYPKLMSMYLSIMLLVKLQAWFFFNPVTPTLGGVA